MTDLGTLPGAAHAEASAINASGQVVGRSGNFENDDVACVWCHAVVWQGGRIVDLGTLPGGKLSDAVAINAQGQLVGWSTTKTGKKHAVLWTQKPG